MALIKISINDTIVMKFLVEWNGPLQVGDKVIVHPFAFGLPISFVTHHMGTVSDPSDTRSYTHIGLTKKSFGETELGMILKDNPEIWIRCD